MSHTPAGPRRIISCCPAIGPDWRGGDVAQGRHVAPTVSHIERAIMAITYGPDCPKCGINATEVIKQPEPGEWFASGRARCLNELCQHEFLFAGDETATEAGRDDGSAEETRP